jgi:class 3 adenylate cyclase
MALSILARRISGGLVANRDGTVEFLYRILRGEHEASRRSAALMLHRLGDDYAPKVLNDFLSVGPEAATVGILHGLRGCGLDALLPALAALMATDSAAIHEALGDLLLASTEGGQGERVLHAVLKMRSAPGEEEGELADEPALAVGLQSERSSFQFEREHISEMVMFFSDIQGYSKKAQILTPMQLSTLIQEYEKILLAHIEGHTGELVKRMGDGHMIVFERPLDAVLSAIRLQKSLRRFNRYRDENNRVVIRIGIHSGKVVRKAQGDVLGNAVNIASRLESSARPGSVLISDRIYEKVKDSVHAREIGHITVKNIAGAIRVFEPYEIVLDLPAELDPLKRAKTPRAESPHAVAPGGDAGSTVSLERSACAEIGRCFSALNALCRAAEDGRVPVSAITEQELARWSRVRAQLPGGAAAPKA